MKLELINIHKKFGEKEVLKGVSFSVEGGEAIGLLGRNGAGKTTSIRILMDVFLPNEGSVLLDGKPLAEQKEIRLGYLPEERGLYPKKRIDEQLIYFARLKGMTKKSAAAAVDRWLDRLEMSEHKTKKLETLSKGNQQKIQLITALAHDPHIVILDEPFSGLDPVNAMLLKDVVKEEIAKGKIVLFSSHQMNYVEEFCDKIAILNNGLVVCSGGLYEVRRSYERNRLVVVSEQSEKLLYDFKSAAQRVEGQRNTIYLTLPDASEKREWMQRLTQAYDIDELRVYEPTLNDIFVQYAGEEQKEEAK